MVSEMVAYKRLDYSIRAFSRSGRRLKVVGQGTEYRALRRSSTSNIEFCGRVSDSELRHCTLAAQLSLFPARRISA